MQAKDLTKEAPRSAYDTSLGGFAILARAVDKGRATINGTNGDFNFDCPVDNSFLSFVGIEGSALKGALAEGKTDEEIVVWVNENSTIKHTDEEKKAWADHFHNDFSYSTDPQKSGWFNGECTRLGLDPMKTTLFDMLDADDKTIGK